MASVLFTPEELDEKAPSRHIKIRAKQNHSPENLVLSALFTPEEISLLQLDEEKAPSAEQNHSHGIRSLRSLKYIIGFTFLLLLVLFGRPSRVQESVGKYVFPTSSSGTHPYTWAMYSPYTPVKPYIPPPQGCHVTQGNIIQRHGARFPTLGKAIEMASAIRKLQSVDDYTDPSLSFLKNFTYDLGVADQVPFGALQSFEAGETAYKRYQHLLSTDYPPFIRASGSGRVIDAANNWTAGFAFASDFVFTPVLSVILDEKLNDTLDDSMCPNAGSADAQTNIWVDKFASPIAARLNTHAPEAGLTPTDIYSLLALCPFHTLAKETLSPFCGMFTPAEFEGFDYFGDLDKYYGTGYGQELGPVQGVGYINELLARLTSSPVNDHTQTNTTLDNSPLTFPLNRTLYADFSHDNQMIAIYAAIGLFPQAKPLDPKNPNPQRDWRVSQMVPFSARMVTEKLTCDRGIVQDYVRILVNDAVQPLLFCGGDENGLCELSAFVKSQEYSRADGQGDFEKCFD